MTGISKYIRFEEEMPPLLQIKEGKKKGKVELTIPNGKIVEVATTHISEEGKKSSIFQIGKTVEIRAEDSNSGKIMKVSIKVKKLAQALGVTTKEIEAAEKKGTLENFISRALETIRKELVISPPIPLRPAKKNTSKPSNKSRALRPPYPQQSPASIPKDKKIPLKNNITTAQSPLPPKLKDAPPKPPLRVETKAPSKKEKPTDEPLLPPRSKVSPSILSRVESKALHQKKVETSSSTTTPTATKVRGHLPALNIRGEILQKFPDYGLKIGEFQQMELFYKTHKAELEQLKEPTHLRKENYTPHLPRSAVYVPDGPRKGFYILLKGKGVKEVGLGADNRATKALSLDTGQIKVFRDGKAEMVPPGEYTANKRAQAYPDVLAAGVPVKYTGPWRSRNREKNIDKGAMSRETDVQKVGFIMDWIEGGELYDITKNGIIDYKEAVFYSLQIAMGLSRLKELKLVHRDLKTENVFMTKELIPKISDFGKADEVGIVADLAGTPGFIAPEVVGYSMFNKPYALHPKEDIWSFGCIMAEMIHGPAWYNWNEQGNFVLGKILNPVDVEEAKETILPDRHDATHLDFLIDACLNNDPDARPDVDKLVEELEKIYVALPNV